MEKMIFNFVVLIFVFNQAISDPDIIEANHQLTDDPEVLQLWKQNTAKDIQDTYQCLDIHHKNISQDEYFERYGNITFPELMGCSREDANPNRMSGEISETIKKCSINLVDTLEEKLKSANKIDPHYVSTSRDEIDSCLKNFWDGWKPFIFNLTETLLSCISEIRPIQEPITEPRTDIDDSSKYCIIRNGIHSDNQPE